MVSIWEVQTVWGTRRKYFQRCTNAERYFVKLHKEFDGCAELHRFEVTTEEFNETDLED